jgi:transcriptional regulator with GAF, ATPase, and Fis domain
VANLSAPISPGRTLRKRNGGQTDGVSWSAWGKGTAVDDLVKALATLALARRELADVLQEITELAQHAIPGTEACSITLIRGEKPFTAAHVGQMALDADEMQYQRGYGPCMDAGRTGLLMLVEDMRKEERWPDYAAEVVQRGVLSSLSVPLPFQGATIGALNTYSGRPDVFDKTEVETAEHIASYIAVAVANADAFSTATTLAAQMREAMESRAVIDMAKGIIMTQRHCTPDEAFTILSHASQRSNRKLRDIAQTIVAGIHDGPAEP